MNWSVIRRMLGLLGLLIGGSMLFSMPWAFPWFGQVQAFDGRGFRGLLLALLCSIGSGGLLFWSGRPETILRKEALATVGFGWIYAGLLGALPFVFAGAERVPGIPMTLADSFFESVSGFTTTGASVIGELENPKTLPRCVLFWRSFTHWLGGMGIIVLFVAILGQLGAGGKALLKREVPGPINESVRPRVRETALTMWAIYVALTGLQAILLRLVGLSTFDAICHAFGTMATGGFSTYNASAGHFRGGIAEWIILVFMVLAATNFSLFDALWRREHRRRWSDRFALVTRDPELRFYLGILLTATVVVAVSLRTQAIYTAWWPTLRHSAFAVVSVMTTTGFATEDFAAWTEFSKGVLVSLMFIGGCAGSTGGGIKVIRVLLLLKIIRMETERAYRPNVVRPVKLAGMAISDSIRHQVQVYFCLILMLFVVGWLGLMVTESDEHWRTHQRSSPEEKLLDCATAVVACLNNIGPGLGVVGPTQNYAAFSASGKTLLTLLMLLGRLEVFAILVLFSPRFWRLQ